MTNAVPAVAKVTAKVMEAGGGAMRTAPAPDAAALLALVRLEGAARGVASLSDLVLLIANETRKLTRAQQIVVFKLGLAGRLEVDGVTGAGTIDRDVPLLQSFRDIVQALHGKSLSTKMSDFALGADVNGAGEGIAQYPFRAALWAPFLSRSGELLGGMLLLRPDPWAQADMALVQRLSVTYAHSWYWLSTSRIAWQPLRWTQRKLALFVGGALCLSLLPVHVTSLAPMEIIAGNASVVAAPLDAVIEDIPVLSGQTVGPGDLLVKFVATTFRNRVEVADREAQVAFARVKKTTLLAVSDMKGRHELALARAEYAVKVAELTFARDLLARTEVRAEHAGVVVVGDKRDLIGKPVATGERLMEVGDPSQLDVRIDVPVSDSIVLGREREAKIYLDSRPLSAERVTVKTSDYQARAGETGQLAYRVVASWPDGAEKPRLGTRGTAQLYGDLVPLLWSLIRRPVGAFRQWSGW